MEFIDVKQGCLPIRKRGQAWSLDLLIAILVFIGTFMLFFLFLNKGAERPAQSELIKESSVISKSLVSDTQNTHDQSLAIIRKSSIDENDLGELLDADYQTLKEQIGASKDFCIYFEDQNGNIISIQDGDKEIYGIGSKEGKLKVSNGDNGDSPSEKKCGANS